MRQLMNHLPVFACVGAMIALILDSQTTAQAAADAVQMCIRSAIPSLFPFFVLSTYLVGYAAQIRIPPLGSLLHIPAGWESIFLLGCVGGYPIGAQCVAQGYGTGKLDEQQASRMIGFCTNCGPSFLFGIVGSAFLDPWTPVAVTFIGMESAMLVGSFWPSAQPQLRHTPNIPRHSLTQAVNQAIRSMSSVCAWIILAKVLLSFLEKWNPLSFADETKVLLFGFLELTNGCLMLNSIANENLRFIIACAITSFGGICVAMQVRTICNQVSLDCGTYLPQKTIQSFAAAILAAAYLIIPGHPILRMLILTGFIWIKQILNKMTVEIPKAMVYNKSNKGGT